MGSDAKVLVRIKDLQTASTLANAGFQAASQQGDWLDLGDREERDAEQLSKTLGTATVWWMIHTAVDQIWLKCFVEGAEVREIRYASDEGWAINSGMQQPFEAAKALKKWFRKRRVSASPDGYEVLDCFLGRVPPEPVKEIKEPGANATLYLPAPIVVEASTLAKKRGVPFAQVMATAWELGKGAVFERRMAEDGPVELAAPPPPDLAVDTVHPEVGVAPLVFKEGDTVKCAVAFPPSAIAELQRMQGAFGHPMKWLLRDAYLIARSRLGLT